MKIPYKTGSWGSQAQERSQRRLEYFRAYQKERYFKHREVILPQLKAYQRQNREQTNAEARARHNIKIPDGQLCEDCNSNSAIVRHHPNYTKPLEVKFLCHSCHRKKAKRGET